MTWQLLVFALLYGIAVAGIGLAVIRSRDLDLPYNDNLTEVSGAIGAAALVAAVFLTVAALL